MGAPWTATLLDQEQIECGATVIAPRRDRVESMPPRPGAEIALELGGRYLIRYLTDAQVAEFISGSTLPHWTTPTPYAIDDVVSWLALFVPKVRRSHALLLDPTRISEIRGPAWVRLGQGIEYYLANGFPEAAIVDVGVIQVR